jgi:hypothetical protein
MGVPGLNAEASLYSSNGHYRAATLAHPNISQVLVPQSEWSECMFDCEISFAECLNSGRPVSTCISADYRCRWQCRLLPKWETRG